MIFEVPARVVTVMSTMPAPVPVAVIRAPESAVMAAVVTVTAAVPMLGGLVTVICVSESDVIAPATPPNRTTVAPARPVPVMVTVLPPTVLPLAGDTPVTAGSVTAGGAPDPVKRRARIVPAATIAAATVAAMALLTAFECRSRERRLPWRRRIFSTALPWTAAGPPDGHRAASSSAASPRCDRPRSCQSGP